MLEELHFICKFPISASKPRNKKRKLCECIREKNKGKAVKLYLYSIVMYSICGQRLNNAHITVRSREAEVYEEDGLPHTGQTKQNQGFPYFTIACPLDCPLSFL